jgi:hypothetical protein
MNATSSRCGHGTSTQFVVAIPDTDIEAKFEDCSTRTFAKSPTAITHDWSALFVLSSVWQSLSNLEVVKNTENTSSFKAWVAGSIPAALTNFGYIEPAHL